jgi:hypothetical protein
VHQTLKAMTPGFEAKTMGSQQHRRAVAILEGMGYAGTHSGSMPEVVLLAEMK